MSNICVLVHSKDCNDDVLNEWCDAAAHNSHIMSYKIFITRENQTYSRIPKTKIGSWKSEVLMTGDGKWSDRLRVALSNLSKEYEHIIFFLEDMIIKNIDVGLFEEVITYHVKNNNDQTKFGSHPFFNISDTGQKIGDFSICYQNIQPYIISHQPVSIFKRSYLEKIIQDSVTPWEHEIKTNNELSNGKYGEFKVCVVGSNPPCFKGVGQDYGEIIEYHHLLSQGVRIPYLGKYHD